MANFEFGIQERSVLTDIQECWFLAIEETNRDIDEDLNLTTCPCELLGRTCTGQCEY